MLFGNAYVEVGDDRFTSYVVISGEAGYSFALAQSYEGQILKGAVKTNVNLAQCIETSKELPIYFWCVTDGNIYSNILRITIRIMLCLVPNCKVFKGTIDKVFETIIPAFCQESIII